MPLAAWGVVRHHWSTVAFGNALNVAGGWLRYLAVVRSSYALAVLSSLVCGGAAAVVVCSFTAVSERWFRPSHRGLATSIAVQSNYLGWALGSLIGAGFSRLGAHPSRDFVLKALGAIGHIFTSPRAFRPQAVAGALASPHRS